MSLITSNTYIEPVASASLNSARVDYNRALNSLLTNFKSTATPVSINIKQSSNAVGPQEGMLFRSDLNKAFYVYDTSNYKGSSIGTGFTRTGIGNRLEEGEAGLKNNAESYEIGELVATVSANPSLANQARLYLCMSNATTAGTLDGFIDVGNPQLYSVNGSEVEISGSKTIVLGLDVLGETVVNSSYNSTSRAVQINTATGPQGHALYSKAYYGPAITADGTSMTSGPQGAIESIVGTDEDFYLWCSYNSISNIVGGVKPTTGGTGVQYLTTSDYRLKENVNQIVNAAERLQNLKPCTFNFKGSSSTLEGFLAHEVEDIVPEAVNGVKDGKRSNGDPIYQGLDHSKLIPLLTAALQEAISRIEKLEEALNDQPN